MRRWHLKVSETLLIGAIELSTSSAASSREWDRTSFPAFPELVAAARDLAGRSGGLCSWSTFGRSRAGQPLGLLTVGDGSRHAVVLAGVHPNEPVGGLSSLRLAAQLVEDAALRERLGFTWHIAVCVDPDGLGLNEGWFADPGSRPAYEQHCFRPAPDEQVEWAFPLTVGDYSFDRPLPETRAMMRLLDEHRPELVVTLHNSELGGAYFRLSGPMPQLYERFLDICAEAGVEPDRGTPEDPFATMVATAVMLNGHPSELYARMPEGGDFNVEWGTGSSAIHYAERFGAFGLIPEVPLWTNPLVGDQRAGSMTAGAARTRAGTALVERGEVIVDALGKADPHLQDDSPVLRAARSFAPVVGQHGRDLLRAAQVCSDEAMTIGQLVALDNTVHQYSIRYGSLLLRAIDTELGRRPGDDDLRDVLEQLRPHVIAWRQELTRSAPWQPIPIHSLVQVQVDATIAVAHALSARDLLP